ncbi:hypothetical protein AMS68_001345 [Peltaster fructicola]|uniref:Phosphatidylinositol-specific phospholipase C X domain-containing protein n=1 Tax=Peltaster fructicola TaxID=286661 RepID=A0A6H0XMH8_9PEZI|nr:hypothetical protein AMS68_001345 [Peltaster fructicola]
MLVVTALSLSLLLGLGDARGWWNHHGQPWDENTSSGLADFALGKVLSDAAPVFGPYKDVQSNTSTWMDAYPDETLIVHMNLPGTHDAATWNYSAETQERNRPITDLAHIIEYSSDWWRCQNRSYIDMLNDGIRVFDLRYAFDVTNTTLVFWHGPALQSQTASVDDAMYGYYKWLDDHPSEAIFLSFQYQSNTQPYGTNNAAVQLALYRILTSPAAKQYIKQDHTTGTLGDSRGKITLLRRFDLKNLPASYSAALPGLHFSPDDWTDNGANITLHYNDQNDTAYIEDYYSPQTARGSSSEENIRWKVNATEAHLNFAASDAHPDELFWSFASSTNVLNGQTPVIQALGDGSSTPLGGVNNQLIPFLQGFHGKRLGIVMFDFYEVPAELLSLFLSLQPPPA